MPGSTAESAALPAQVELVGCDVRGRLWREVEGDALRVRNFVDVGNVYSRWYGEDPPP